MSIQSDAAKVQDCLCPMMNMQPCLKTCAWYVDVSGKLYFGHCSIHHLAVMLCDPSMIAKVMKQKG